MPKRTPDPNHHDAIKSLKALFASDSGRVERLSVEVAGIAFDWSKTHLDEAMIGRFSTRLSNCGFDQARSALFAGEIVNLSEARPATHTFERVSGTGEEASIAAARRIRTRALVDAVEAGAFGDVTAILHIGIGGSVTGPALLVDAL
ncbi:MAG: glucose-6-phosphate isomerase, partial [Sphingomicrobium sp.]